MDYQKNKGLKEFLIYLGIILFVQLIKNIGLLSGIWDKLLASGDLYKKKYGGYYCVGCESFKTGKILLMEMRNS